MTITKLDKISCPHCEQYMYATSRANTTVCIYVIKQHMRNEHPKPLCKACIEDQPIVLLKEEQ